MALWTIGDFHLIFSADKSMEIFDLIWKNHEKKMEKHYYPPTTIGEQESSFTLMAEEYGEEKVIY